MKEKYIEQRPDGAYFEGFMYPVVGDLDGATKDKNVLIFLAGDDIVEIANINELLFGKPKEEDNESGR